MHIEDLTRFPQNHPPSPYNFPIQLKKGNNWGQGVLRDGLILCAIGWLGENIPSEGKTPSECISRLWHTYKPRYIISDGTAGFHNCELCFDEEEWYPDGDAGPIVRWQGLKLRVYGHGHFLLHYKENVYLSPALILHYILDHGYKPPDIFIEAVLNGEFLALSDLLWKRNDAS